MNRIFNSVKLQKPKYNAFDLSHEKKLSLNMGELIPMYLQEIVPGDRFRVNSELFVRFAPMLAPIMHRVNVYVHYFFVPNRLIWTNWESFITGGPTGLSAPTLPKVNIKNYSAQTGKGSLADYLGVPTVSGSGGDLYCSALPFRAYQEIYNQYFRDQNLMSEINYGKTDTVNFADTFTLRKRCWEKDYFTSALPWTQRGGDVSLPGTPNYLEPSVAKYMSGVQANPGTVIVDSQGQLNNSTNDIVIQNLESYDISINDLRRATKLQQWLERNALGGSRYVEQILAHFGVRSSDRRLQRPEYLGGGKQNVVISEVLNTTGTTGGLPQGNMAGHGIAVGNTNQFKAYFEEHGYVLGIMSVLPRTAYHQGIDRQLVKFDKFDYYFPEFAHLGEQPVYNKEVWGNSANPDNVFGYQSRYAEYKFNPDRVHGDFKDNLAFWHMGRTFSSEPALNAAFVESDPTHRIFAVTDAQYDKLYVQVYNNIRALRPMPVFGTPSL